MPDAERRRVSWGWIVFVVVLGVIVLFVTGFGVGECRDASPGSGAESVCTSGPAIGVAGVWVAWIAYALLAAYGLWQAFRRR